MDRYDDIDATETIQRVWRGFLGRRKSARIQLNKERDKMRSKQHKKHNNGNKESINARGHTERSSHQLNGSADHRPKVSDIDDSYLYDDQADVTVYKAVKRGTNIGSYERKSNHAPHGGRPSYNLNEQEDDVLRDSLERLPKQATADKQLHVANPVVSAPSPVYNIDPSLIHSHLSVIDEGDEMVRDSLSSTAAFKFTPRGPLNENSNNSNQSNVFQSPRGVPRGNKGTGKTHHSVVADSLENPPSLRFPPRVERQTSSRTHSGSSRNDTDTVDTEAEEVHTGRRSSEADSIEYGQFIKTDHYDEIIASLGDEYNGWEDLDRGQQDDVIMEDSLRRSRNFQNDLVLAGIKHANQANHRGADASRHHQQHHQPQQQQRQPQPPAQPQYTEDSAIPRFTSRKSSGHLKAFDSDCALSRYTDSGRREPTKNANTPTRGAPKQEAFSPEKPYIPSVRDLLAVSPEPADRKDRGIAHAEAAGLNSAHGVVHAGGAPKSMLSRLEQAQQMYEANVKKNFPITAAGMPATSGAQSTVLKESLLNAHLPLRMPPHATRDTSEPRDYSLSPVPLSGRSRTDSYSSNAADKSPRRVPVLLVPSTHANSSGLRGPSPRLPSYPGSDSPTPSQQSNQGSYQPQQQQCHQQQQGYGFQHAQLSQRGPPSARDSPYQQGYEQGYEVEQPQVVVPKSIRLVQPVPPESQYQHSQIPAPTAMPAQQPSLAQPAAQRRPPQFPGQVQPQAQQAPQAKQAAGGGYFAAYTDSQQTQNRSNSVPRQQQQQQPSVLAAAPAALAPVVANRFSNLPSKLIPAAVARPVMKPAAAVVNKNTNMNNNNARPKDMNQTKMTEIQEQKLLQEIEDLNRVRLQKLQELARIEQIEKAAVAAAAQSANSPRLPKKAPDPVREKEKRAFKAGAKDVNPTPVVVKPKSKASGAAGRPQPAGLDEWSGAAQHDQHQSNLNPRNGYLHQTPVHAPAPTPIQPLLAPPTGADVHGGLNPGGFAAGAGYLQVYKKKQEVGIRGNSNPRGRRGNGEDALSANGDAQSEGMLFNRRAQGKAGGGGAGGGYQQQYNAAYEETASLPAIPSARQAKSSNVARPVSGHPVASAAPSAQQGYSSAARGGPGGGHYCEDEPEMAINPQFVHPLDGQNRRVLNASRNNTMSAPSRLLDESNHRQGSYSNGDGYGNGKLPELGKVSHDYGMPSQLPVPIYSMQKKVAPVNGYAKR